MRVQLKKCVISGIAGLLLSALPAASANGDTLVAGTPLGHPSAGSLPPVGNLVGSITNQPYTLLTAGPLPVVAGTGSYSEQVYKVAGTTTLVFDFTIATGTIETVSLNNFGGFATDIFSNGGGLQATSVKRNNGGTINLGFDAPSGFTGASEKFIIQTNAPSYALGSISFIDGGSTSVVGFQPAAPLPATASMGFGLLGGLGCLTGMNVLRRRRMA